VNAWQKEITGCQEAMAACLEMVKAETVASWKEMKACLDEMVACLESKEPTSDEIKVCSNTWGGLQRRGQSKNWTIEEGVRELASSHRAPSTAAEELASSHRALPTPAEMDAKWWWVLNKVASCSQRDELPCHSCTIQATQSSGTG
jgi:hypothetical protein